MFIHRFIPIIALAGALAAPLAAQAQTAPAPVPVASPGAAHHHHHHKSAFFRALGTVNLTPEQQQQVDTLRQQERAANASADQPTKQANAAKMRDGIMGILTPDQKAQMQTAMQHEHGNGPQAAPNPSAPPSQ